ncbi:MAG: protein kinase domain-containing protein [Verrucomicrobiaceae bacterium]
MSLPETAGHELQDLIGGGSVGAVYRAISTSGKACAVKVFSSMSINRKGLSTTLRALQAMPAHRGVLPVLAFDLDHSPYFASTPLVGMMTKDAQGRKVWQSTTLENLCGRVTPDQAWRYIYELADGVAWMHKHGVAHGNLKTSSVLVTDDPEGATRIADAGQGWVGGIHHIELRDHFMYLCPEQMEQPEGFFGGFGASWDVYAFGVIAYRLLTGQFPRGGQAWTTESALQKQKVAQGLNYAVNSMSLMQAVKAQPRITWPSPAQTPWDERRRQIIERALDFDPLVRWKDVREIAREFEVLEADYLLEESRAQTALEKRRQSRKIASLNTLWMSLAAVLLLLSMYTAATLWRAKKAEGTIESNLAEAKAQTETRDAKIGEQAASLKVIADAKKGSDQNLQRAQTMVDQLITQLVQLPTGNNLEVAFSRQQLSDAAAYVQEGLPTLEKEAALAPERARAYGNLGMIYLKQRKSTEAAQFLDKARVELHALLARDPESPHASLYHQWLGRFSLLLANMRAARGDDETALTLLKEATANLDPGIEANPKDRNVRYEAAQAWFSYGARCRLEGSLEESNNAQTRASTALDEKVIGGSLMPEESFLLARVQLERGLSLRDSGKLDEAAAMLVTSVEQMANLVAGSAPRNQEQALVLAEAYTELADLVGRHFSSKEATDAHYEAIKVLLELIRLEPEWNEAKYLLARNYGQIAGLERDLGNSAEAVRKKQDAIELINEIVAEDVENRNYLYQQAKLRGELAELMGDGGKAKDALGIIKQAVESLQALIDKLPDGKHTSTRKEWEVQLATLHGVQGQILEFTKQRDAARKAFATAEKQWQHLASIDKDDEQVKNGLSWVQNRLQKLR